MAKIGSRGVLAEHVAVASVSGEPEQGSVRAEGDRLDGLVPPRPALVTSHRRRDRRLDHHGGRHHH
ncbi:MAG: hypothetical protein ACRDH5_09560 [bacterium]